MAKNRLLYRLLYRFPKIGHSRSFVKLFHGYTHTIRATPRCHMWHSVLSHERPAHDPYIQTSREELRGASNCFCHSIHVRFELFCASLPHPTPTQPLTRPNRSKHVPPPTSMRSSGFPPRASREVTDHRFTARGVVNVKREPGRLDSRPQELYVGSPVL